MTEFDQGMLLGVMVGCAFGFFIAMWFQVSVVMKFKEELINWFLTEEN